MLDGASLVTSGTCRLIPGIGRTEDLHLENTPPPTAQQLLSSGLQTEAPDEGASAAMTLQPFRDALSNERFESYRGADRS